MRPLRLKMQAFGPYAGTEVIDFTILPDSVLFLITGPTGSGKSTLIDAMSYALYGQTCTEQRSGESMRCQFAPTGLPTEVTFDFRLGDKTYRVTRSPDQERAKKRGEGTITAPGKATIWRRTEATDADEGAVLASKKKEVTVHVQELLGFDCSQFRQVMVLPQGQFRELLTADSKAREEILERLFQTEVYSRIQSAMKERSREVMQRHQDLRTQRTTILNGIEVDAPEELSCKLEDAATTVANLKAERDRLNGAANIAAETLDAARQIERKFHEHEESIKELEHLAKAQPAIEDQRNAIQRARKAEPIVALEEAVIGRENESALAITALEQARKDLANALTAKQAAIQTFESEKTREAVCSEEERNLASLRKLKTKVGMIDVTREALAKARRNSKETRAELEQLRSDSTTTRGKIDSTWKEMESLRAIAGQLDILNERSAKLASVHENRTRLEDAFERGKRADAVLARCNTNLARCESHLRASRNREDALQYAWKNGRAAILAATLRDGLPCPVCGATHHPRPAFSDEKPPGDDEIEEAKQQTEAFEVALNEARQAQTKQNKICAEIAERIRSFKEQLGRYADRMTDEIEREVEALASQERSAHTAANEYEKLRAQLERLREKDKQLSGKSPELESTATAVSNQVAAIEADLKAVEREVPENLQSLAALTTALNKSEVTVQEMKAALRKASDHKDAAEIRAAKAETRVAELAVSFEVSSERSKQAIFRFNAALTETGFEDRAAFEAARKILSSIRGIEQTVKHFDGCLAAARYRNERAAAALKGLTPPSLETLVAAATSARQAAEQKLKEHATQVEKLRQLEKTKRDLKRVESQLAAIQAEHETIGRLAEVANGQNEKRLTLQRYVLASLLDDVLVAASRRLRIMSQGRYEMRRGQTVRDQRCAGGLDLEIFDSFSGQSRVAGTLSGGESFLAALSLALGLSDVVQSHIGGIRMETLFIDEGFGSLDPEALDHAFQALIDLQKGGRMVGIISHVEELKQRIDCRLEIIAGQRGSHARFAGATAN